MPKKSSLTERLEVAAQETAPPIPVAVPETIALVNGPSTEAPSLSVAERLRRGRKPPPTNESKHDKLVRLADSRVSKACRYISMIGNLATYKPSPREIEMIMTALGESCAGVSNRLNGVRRESISFTLR